jgi:hypothetical protein
MSNFIFTICAKNYIGLAQVLKNSIIKTNPDINFLIFVADEIDNSEISSNDNILVAKDILGIAEDKWHQLAFKYELTEFCTCIKPYCFQYIFDNFGPCKIIYFDPDIFVFNNLTYIFNELSQYNILLTPHILTPQQFYTGDLKEQNILSSGIFNLGFLGLSYSEQSILFLDWWKTRLDSACYRNAAESYFTDQRWIDFVPSLFSSYKISNNLGLNLAPWNFFEREVFFKNNNYYVKNRINGKDESLLLFVHFSGFKYTSLINGDVIQDNIQDISFYPDLEVLFNDYGQSLSNSLFLKYSTLSYTYNNFKNGDSITIIYRRLFRRLIEDNNYFFEKNPFLVTSNSFYTFLKKKAILKKGMKNIDKTNLTTMQFVDNKVNLINKILYFLFRIIGSRQYFLLIRLMRVYSKIENHIFLFNYPYTKNFKLRN